MLFKEQEHILSSYFVLNVQAASIRAEMTTIITKGRSLVNSTYKLVKQTIT